MSHSLRMTTPVTRMQLVTTGTLVLLLLICLGLGSSWLGTDRTAQRASRLVQQIDLVAAIPTRDSSVGLMISTAQLVPQLELLGVDSQHLAIRLEALQERWIAGVKDKAARTELVAMLEQVRANVFAANLARRQHNQERLYQLLSLLATALLAALTTVGLLTRQPSGSAVPLTFFRFPNSESVVDDIWPYDAMHQKLFDQTHTPVLYSDAQLKIVAANPAYQKLTGYSEAECLGQLVNFNVSGQQDVSFFEAAADKLKQSGEWTGEVWLRHKDGQAFSEKVTRIAVFDQQRGALGHVTMSMDGDHNEASNRLMLWQAHHDSLTKLPNRNLLEDRLSRALLRPARGGALLSVDIDRFKDLNDSAGPAKGDQVLIDAAYRLAMVAESSDTVARIGADQFVLLLEDVDDSRKIEALANKLVAAFAEPFVLPEQSLFCSISVGVVRYPRDGNSMGELLQKADAAQAQVKSRGGAGVAYFEPDMNTRAVRRLVIESHLREAIDKGEFDLHLQPVLALDNSTIVGAEALLRWEHKSLGFVSPAEFIPIAESTGLITPIGLWVVAEAARIQESWRLAGLGHLTLNLNVSAVQIRDEAEIETFFTALDRLDRERITIELTETAIVEDRVRAAEFLQALKARGCQIALDDFGTGFSSLSYLRDFQFDVLKIDRSFVSKLDHPRDCALVASMLSMGRIMGMKGVAEGVETLEQQEQLQAMGCAYTQGYYFARPMPQADFIDFATNQSNKISGVAG